MLSILTVALIAPQASATGNRSRKPFVPGMVIVESERSVDETWDTLVGALESNPNIRLIATIDHAAAAASAGLELDDNRVAVFGNPALGSPLMVENQVTGLDLPQKIQVFESRDRVWVGFNDATYLEARHHLGDQPTLDTIAGSASGAQRRCDRRRGRCPLVRYASFRAAAQVVDRGQRCRR